MGRRAWKLSCVHDVGGAVGAQNGHTYDRDAVRVLALMRFGTPDAT